MSGDFRLEPLPRGRGSLSRGSAGRTRRWGSFRSVKPRPLPIERTVLQKGPSRWTRTHSKIAFRSDQKHTAHYAQDTGPLTLLDHQAYPVGRETLGARKNIIEYHYSVSVILLICSFSSR